MDAEKTIENKRGRRWQAVRERDVWRVVKAEKRWWKQRFQIYKVKAHADKQKLEGRWLQG